MKLSRAMKKGRKLIPDGLFGTYFLVKDEEVLAACDLGCALYAAGLTSHNSDCFVYLHDAWPELDNDPIKGLPGDDSAGNLFEQIGWINDFKLLTTKELVQALEKEGY